MNKIVRIIANIGVILCIFASFVNLLFMEIEKSLLLLIYSNIIIIEIELILKGDK